MAALHSDHNRQVPLYYNKLLQIKLSFVNQLMHKIECFVLLLWYIGALAHNIIVLSLHSVFDLIKRNESIVIHSAYAV